MHMELHKLLGGQVEISSLSDNRQEKTWKPTPQGDFQRNQNVVWYIVYDTCPFKAFSPPGSLVKIFFCILLLCGVYFLWDTEKKTMQSYHSKKPEATNAR